MIIRSWMTETEIESNVHLIACAETREAAIVDAGAFPADMREEIERLGLTVTQILLTHSHWDHVDALEGIQSTFKVPVVASRSIGKNCRVVQEGDEVTVGRLRARVVQTSGHTPDSISFLFGGHVAFTGDALFAGSVGGTSNDALQREEIGHVRSKILSLPDDCEIRCGHGPASTVGIEKGANPFFN